MAYGLAHIVFCLSQFMSLNPSDVILTGPPPGIGMGQKPQQYLRPGYIVEMGIAGLGQQREDAIAGPE